MTPTLRLLGGRVRLDTTPYSPLQNHTHFTNKQQSYVDAYGSPFGVTPIKVSTTDRPVFKNTWISLSFKPDDLFATNLHLAGLGTSTGLLLPSGVGIGGELNLDVLSGRQAGVYTTELSVGIAL